MLSSSCSQQLTVSVDQEKASAASTKQEQCPWRWNDPYKHLIPAWPTDDPVSPYPCYDQSQCSSVSGSRILASGMDSDLDMKRINDTIIALKTSNFYYESLSWQDATKLLRRTPIGTFLVRDSSDPNHLFSLSVQTVRGPTSVRVHYGDGQFRLDSESHLVGLMPLFDCVVKMLQYYLDISDTPKSRSCVWVDNVTGRRDLPIHLKKPLYKNVVSLQHSCRLKLNRHLSKTSPGSRAGTLDALGVPPAIKTYLNSYQHCI